MAEDLGLDELVAANRAMRQAMLQAVQVVAALRSEEAEQQDEGLTLLLETLGVSFGDDAKVLCQLLRDSGVVPPLASLLADADPVLRTKALLVLGNICSDAVDADSAYTKEALLQEGADRPLFACLDSADLRLCSNA